MPVPSATITAWSAPRAAPWRCSASAATFASLSTATGRPSRSLIRSRKGTSSIGRWFDQHRDARLGVDERGQPEAHGIDVGGGRAHLLDRIHDDVERLLAVRSAPLPTHPVVHHELLVDHPAEQLGATGIDPDHAPRRHRRTL